MANNRQLMEIIMFKRLFLTFSMLCVAIPSAFAAEMLEVNLGYSHVIGPVAEMSTVIVGDDRVADATLGGGGTIILTGKMLGATNLIVLDRSGRELLATPLHVMPQDRRLTTNIRILSGTSAVQNYVCGPTPGCSPVAGTDGTYIAPTVNGSEDGTTTDAQASDEQVSINP